VTVLRRAHIEVLPDTDKFDDTLKAQLAKGDPGGKAGKQIGGQLNRALKRLDLDPIDVKADPRQAYRKIEELEGKLRRLAHDSATVEVKIQTERALSQLTRFKKQLGDVGDEAGPEAAEAFATSFSKNLSQLLPGATVSPAIVAAAAAAAPLVASTIAGAVVGGAGIGGVIGGVYLAAKDPRVQQAANKLSTTLLGELQGKASGFVGPVLGAIDKIRVAFDDLDPELTRIFKSSRFVQPLVDGAVQGAKGFIAGFANAVDKADPVIEQLGLSLSQLGTAAGDFFTKMAGHAGEGAAAIRELTHATTDFLSVAGDTIGVLSDVFGVLDKVNDGFKKLSGGASLLDSITFSGFYETIKTGGKNTDAAALSSEKYFGALERVKGAVIAATTANVDFVATEDTVKAQQQEVSEAQTAYAHILDTVGGKLAQTAQEADGLRKTIQALYGAQVQATDANEAYEASWDSLSQAIHKNGKSLNIHTAAGRANRDALEAVATATRDGYVADIQAGIGIDQATKKHDKRIGALKEEAHRSGLDKKATDDLISTYGAIPKGKTTKLVVAGVDQIVSSLKDLYVFQRSLADGIPIASEVAKLNEKKGPAKRYGGYAYGGQIGGWSPNSRADNIPAMLTANEWVHPVDAVDYYGAQAMSAIQHKQVPREVLTGFASGRLGKMGDLPLGLAAGGQVAPIDTSALWRFVATMRNTRIPSKAEVASKVPGGGAAGPFLRAQDGKPYIWASAGPHGYDCSGIVSAVYNLLHGKNPYSHTFSTGSLPGRWFTKPGVGGPLTAAWSNPGEAPASSTTGHMMGMVGGLTFESTGSRGVHLGKTTRRLTDFAHIAHYARGGQVPVFDAGGTLTPGLNTVYNGLGRPEPLVPASGGDIHIHIHDSVIASKQHAEDLVVAGYNAAKAHRRIS
jgi:hypothetical protein